jgi:hypothetical protein
MHCNLYCGFFSMCGSNLHHVSHMASVSLPSVLQSKPIKLLWSLTYLHTRRCLRVRVFNLIYCDLLLREHINKPCIFLIPTLLYLRSPVGLSGGLFVGASENLKFISCPCLNGKDSYLMQLCINYTRNWCCVESRIVTHLVRFCGLKFLWWMNG